MPFISWLMATLQGLTLSEVIVMSLLVYVAVKLARRR